jgi:hypothetical protein
VFNDTMQICRDFPGGAKKKPAFLKGGREKVCQSRIDKLSKPLLTRFDGKYLSQPLCGAGLKTVHTFSENCAQFFEKVCTLFGKTVHSFFHSVAGAFFREVNGCQKALFIDKMQVFFPVRRTHGNKLFEPSPFQTPSFTAVFLFLFIWKQESRQMTRLLRC